MRRVLGLCACTMIETFGTSCFNLHLNDLNGLPYGHLLHTLVTPLEYLPVRNYEDCKDVLRSPGVCLINITEMKFVQQFFCQDLISHFEIYLAML